jgi:hypothetical protein
VSPVINDLLSEEKAAGIHSLPVLQEFARAVAKNREDLGWMLSQLRREGKRVVAVSAPAKGMTLLNYCRLGTETLEYVTEKSKLKIGRMTPGMHIPVMPDSRLLEDKPDYALLLAWNFAKEIMENLKAFRMAGGKFIVPIPSPHIVS